MNYQQFFDACCKALLGSSPFPSPRPASYTDNHILMSFQDIRRDMDPRLWPTEVEAISADFDLDDSWFKAAWEKFSRKEAASHGG